MPSSLRPGPLASAPMAARHTSTQDRAAPPPTSAMSQGSPVPRLHRNWPGTRAHPPASSLARAEELAARGHPSASATYSETSARLGSFRPPAHLRAPRNVRYFGFGLLPPPPPLCRQRSRFHVKAKTRTKVRERANERSRRRGEGVLTGYSRGTHGVLDAGAKG